MTAALLCDHLARVPLIAVLRGLEPRDAVAVGQVLVEAGIGILEVPLNSPDACTSIERLAELSGTEPLLIGAGTVMTKADVAAVHDAGGQLIVSPHLDAAVVGAAVERGMVVVPGVVTPAEAFNALALSASALKLFPAEMVTPAAVKALRAVLPADVVLIPTGGINAANVAAYWQAGADGFGTGGSLFRPGMSLQQIGDNAAQLVAACQRLTA